MEQEVPRAERTKVSVKMIVMKIVIRLLMLVTAFSPFWAVADMPSMPIDGRQQYCVVQTDMGGLTSTECFILLGVVVFVIQVVVLVRRYDPRTPFLVMLFLRLFALIDAVLVIGLGRSANAFYLTLCGSGLGVCWLGAHLWCLVYAFCKRSVEVALKFFVVPLGLVVPFCAEIASMILEGEPTSVVSSCKARAEPHEQKVIFVDREIVTALLGQFERDKINPHFATCENVQSSIKRLDQVTRKKCRDLPVDLLKQAVNHPYEPAYWKWPGPKEARQDRKGEAKRVFSKGMPQ